MPDGSMIAGLRRLVSGQRDTTASQLIGGGLTSLVLATAGLALGLISNLLLTRMLGIEIYGSYAIAIAWVMILVVLVKLGLDTSILKFGAIYIQDKKPGSIRAMADYCTRQVLTSGSILAVIILGLRALIPEVFAGLSWAALALSIFLAVTLGCLSLSAAFALADQRVFQARIHDQVIRQALLIASVLVVAALGWPLSLEAALMLTTASALAALGLLLMNTRDLYAAVPATDVSATDRREWVVIGRTLVLVACLQQIIQQSSVILLGWFSTHAAAGQFAVASRLAALVSFGLACVNIASGPMIAKLYRQGDREELRKLAYVSARAALALAVASATVLAFFGKQILSLFGADFVTAYPVLMILVVGSLVNAATGSVGYFLSMTGQERVQLWSVVAGLAVNVALSVALMPAYGPLGGAIAASAGVIVWNTIQYAAVRNRLGVDTSALGRPLKSATHSS